MNSRLPAEAGFERIFIQSAASDAGNALTYGWLLAAGYGLAFLYGLFAAGNSDINFLSLNGADNGLHLVSAAAGLPSPSGRPTGPPPAGPPTAASRPPRKECRDGQTTTT